MPILPNQAPPRLKIHESCQPEGPDPLDELAELSLQFLAKARLLALRVRSETGFECPERLHPARSRYTMAKVVEDLAERAAAWAIVQGDPDEDLARLIEIDEAWPEIDRVHGNRRFRLRPIGYGPDGEFQVQVSHAAEASA